MIGIKTKKFRPFPAKKEKSPFKNPADAKKERPNILFILIYVLSIFASGMGDSGILGKRTMYVKVAVLISVLLALWRLLERFDFDRLRHIGFFLFIFAGLLAAIYIYSLILWGFGAAETAVIKRGTEKMLFQIIVLLNVVCANYIFDNAVDYTFYGLVLANLTIIAYYMPGNSISAIIEALTYGPWVDEMSEMASAFSYKIEISDITFCMGLFIIYYLFYKPAIGKRWLHILAAAFLFNAGMKRIALAALILGVCYVFGLGFLKDKGKKRAIYITAIVITVSSFIYLLNVKNGRLTEFMLEHEIDMSGRDKIYAYANRFYDISPTFTGYGFQYSVSMLREMNELDTAVIHSTGFHNDVLTLYIEMGFVGFFVWFIYNFLFVPLRFGKRYEMKIGVCYIALLLYAWVTYLTDNTMYYFFMSMIIKMIPISVALRHENKVISKHAIPHKLKQKEVDEWFRKSSNP